MPTISEKYLVQLAEAFPRVKKSTNTKRNWIYDAHVALAAAMPDRILPPHKYKEGVRKGVYIDTRRRGVVEFLQMPFLSDIAYMLASDLPDRVIRAKSCVIDALKGTNLHKLNSLLEQAFYSTMAQLTTVIPPDDLKHPFMALAAAFAVTSVFAKFCLAAQTDHISFTWGTAHLYDLVPRHDGNYPPSLETLNDMCIIQTCNILSYMAMVGSVEARPELSPPTILDDDALLIDSWGAGWLIWQLLEMRRKYPPSTCKTQTEAIERLCVLFTTSFTSCDLITGTFLEGMPAVDGPSADIRDEVITERRYSLWPGITDIIWKEGRLEKLTLLATEPKGHIFSVLHGRMDLSRGYGDWADEKDAPVRLFVEVPSLEDEDDWALARKNATDGPDELLIPLEVIRMCCVPAEQKARRGRVPSGYVQTPKKAKKADAGQPPAVRVTYVPRVQYRRPEGAADSSGGDGEGRTGTGRTHALHQVAGFIRQLPIDWKASETARQNAEASGISLPAHGVTFVRPHSRGGGEDKETAPRRTVKVRRPSSSDEEGA